jgi:hypothetical protein
VEILEIRAHCVLWDYPKPPGRLGRASKTKKRAILHAG